MSESTPCFMVERRDAQFVRVDNGETLCDTVYLLPPGAMFWRSHGPLPAVEDPDPRPMPHLSVMTAAGLWCIDCPSSDDHTYWTRAGTAPKVTAAPSVNINNEEWHGHLKAGALVR